MSLPYLAPQPIVQAPIDMSKVYSKESVNKVLGDPRSRFKVVQAVERIVDLIESRKQSEMKDVISVDSAGSVEGIIDLKGKQ